MNQVSEAGLKARFVFVTGVRFELVYSLSTLLHADAGIHSTWREEARTRVPAALKADLEWFGTSSFFWILVGDALGDRWPGDDVEELLNCYRELGARELLKELFVGALHDSEVAERVLGGTADLAKALRELPAEKREWLEHIGLYPPAPETPTFQALERCVNEPVEARRRIERVLRTYSGNVFGPTWRALRPGLARSLEEKRRLFEATSLEEFFRLTLIRVEANSEAGVLRALRGGYQLPYERVQKVYVIPSVFNHGRYWTAFEREGGAVAFLPYYDYRIPVGGEGAQAPGLTPKIDLPLVFKALGDPTRLAVATLIAKTPMSSAQLAAKLEVSRPTISHHVLLLREAGLLEEESRGGSVYLSLRKQTLEQLSPAAVQRFFGE